MSKELKKELFNIYDIVVFKDENGITQDCVCIIGSNKEVDKIIDMIECNNHSISIYENGSYTVWEKDGEDMPYYKTNKKIIHLYTLKNDNRFYEIYPTNDYEAIDNANPSEALECLAKVYSRLPQWDLSRNIDQCNTIKQALLKAQEPKQYLKWEDLEFSFKDKYMKVKLNGNIYTLRYTRNVLMEFPVVYLEFDNTEITIIDCKKQFFNDLRLERVEE